MGGSSRARKVAKDIFDQHMKGPNQLHILREDVQISKVDLLKKPTGEITEKGLRSNINVGIQYLEAWMRGTGCVPLYNLMEDAATAEISRAQVWQWIQHRVKLSNGQEVTKELVKKIVEEELKSIKAKLGESVYSNGKFESAKTVFEKMMFSKTFVDFLTLAAIQFKED